MRLTAGSIIRGSGLIEEYEVIEWLGEGRTAEVYRVRQARPESGLPKSYALKISKADNDHRLAERNALLRREANVLERLPTFVSMGNHHGRTFLVRTLFSGPSLSELLTRKRGYLRFDEGMRLFAGLTEVVALCHRSNFVLRDLRPGNVIIDENVGAAIFDFDSSEVTVQEDTSETLFGAAEYVPPNTSPTSWTVRLRTSPTRVRTCTRWGWCSTRC